jgi:hypothetical protein
MPAPALARRVRALAAAAVVCVSAPACNDDDGDPDGDGCVDRPASCEQLYPPEWDEVWQNTIEPTCTAQGSSCHFSADASGAANGGPIFADQAQAYGRLLDGEHPLVVPGDPECSPLYFRLATDDTALRMPPGEAPVDERALCSIAAWIESGADP